MSAGRPLCEQAQEIQIQHWPRRRLIVEGRPVEAEQFTLATYTHNRLFNVSNSSSLTNRSGKFFQPLKCQREPPDLFIKFCFLGLLLPLLALAVGGEDAGSVFQLSPFPGPYQVGMNLDNWLFVLLPSSASSATRNL